MNADLPNETKTDWIVRTHCVIKYKMHEMEVEVEWKKSCSSKPIDFYLKCRLPKQNKTDSEQLNHRDPSKKNN